MSGIVSAFLHCVVQGTHTISSSLRTGYHFLGRESTGCSATVSGTLSRDYIMFKRCSDHEQVVGAFQNKKRQEQRAIDEYQKQLDDGKQVVLRERADNRVATNRLRTERLQVTNALALVRRDRDDVDKKTKELQAREEESKRNRYDIASRS